MPYKSYIPGKIAHRSDICTLCEREAEEQEEREAEIGPEYFAKPTPFFNPKVLHQYSGQITRLDLEESRAHISDWLDNDNHGFVIPGGEWGIRLVDALNDLLAATQDGYKIQEGVR